MSPQPPAFHVSVSATRSHVAGIILLMGCLGVNDLCAQSVASLAEAEVARRSRLVAEASLQLQEASVLFDAGKTKESLQIYQATFEALPNVHMASGVRAQAKDGYAIVGVQRARELAKEGRFEEAKALLTAILDPDVAPKHPDALRFQRELADPDRWPPALSAEHIEKVGNVQDLLLKGNSAHEIGDFNLSDEFYKDALRVDPYNSAARRGMERNEMRRSEYFDSARDQTRAKRLNEVNQTWEDSVPPPSGFADRFGTVDYGATSKRRGREELTRRMRDLVLNQVAFSGASLDETIEYLRVRSRDLDPTGKGIDFVVDVSTEVRARPITLSLTDVPFDEVLRYITEMAGASYRVEEQAVRVISLSSDTATIISKTYRVPPSFIETSAIGTNSATTNDPFGAGANATGTGLNIRRMSAQEFLESRGVVFAPGTGASYNASSNLLIVRNSAAQLNVVDMLVEQSATASPKQVQIDVRVMEASEAKLKELGFDWILGPFNVNSAKGVGNGGTIGNQNLAPNFLATQFPTPFAPVLGNPITAGLRSSNDITSSNRSIDAVLAGGPVPTTNRSPGVFSVAGVFTQPQFQMVVRALDQQKGVDLLSKPSVIAKSGQAVSVRVVREMLYPTEFDPPQIPQVTFGGRLVLLLGIPLAPPAIQPWPGGLGPFGVNLAGLFPLFFNPNAPLPVPVGTYSVTGGGFKAVVPPATPSAFESTQVGTILEAEPVISADGKSVELNIAPTHRDLDGFIDYGNPYSVPNTVYNDAVGTGPGFTGLIANFAGPNTVTTFSSQPNTIVQPIFSVRKTSTAVKVWDGATIVLAGMVKDSTTDIEDGVPILQDIPGVGRLFQTKISEVRRSHLLFFVTVNVLDPGGQKINQVSSVSP